MAEWTRVKDTIDLHDDSRVKLPRRIAPKPTKAKKPRKWAFTSDLGYESFSGEVLAGMHDKIKEILVRCGQEALENARKTCPVRTGRLLATHRMLTFDDRPAVLLSMMDENTQYGRYVHFSDKYKLRPPGVYRWFERAMEEAKPRVRQLVRAEISRYLAE